MLFPVAEVTRLLSNLIKYSFVDFSNKEARVIDYEKKAENFAPLEKKSKVLVKTLEEVEQEQEIAATEDFAPGVPVVNFDEMLAEKTKEAEEAAEQVLSEAGQKAETLIQEAEDSAEQVRQAAYEEGVAEGREEGLAKAAEEISAARQELEESRIAQEQEYKEILSGVESRYVEVLCSLVQKITGVLLSDQKDVMLHLIRSGIADMEPAKRYVIRVSPEDMLLVEGNKDELAEKAGLGAAIEVQEEKGLGKDECIIETDTQMVDCGFKTQLDNLVSTLRMLAQ